MTFLTEDYDFMARALRLAERGLATTDPNPRVGCVLVKDGRVVGEGWHRRAGEPHAEVIALVEAGERARGATAYVTLEPCCHYGKTPPCSNALIEAGVSRVVAAMVDPNPRVAGQGLSQLAEAGIAVESGLMQAQAEALNPGFIMRMRHQRPYVRCKLAMSLDGRTALANGVSKWITGEAAREDVQRWRARSSAIMTGVGTVLADDPALNVRWLDLQSDGGIRQPLRVVLDSRLRTPAQACVLKFPGQALIITATMNEGLAGRKYPESDIAAVASHHGALDLQAVLSLLAGRGINELWVEAGPTLSGAMLRQGLIDELVIYMAPLIMGDKARGLFSLPEFESMTQGPGVEIRDMCAIGTDWRIIAKPKAQAD